MRILFVIIACFAIGSIGFFLAVLVESSTQTPTSESKQIAIVSTTSTRSVMQNLAAPDGTSSVSTTSASNHSADPLTTNVPSVQASSDDRRAATKLKILESLNQK